LDILEVIDGGMFATVQDLGRYGYQRYGIPVSGAMDPFALRAANLLAGNPEGDAGLEITLTGAQVRFLANTVVAVTGADLGPLLDGRPLPMWRAVAVRHGGTLAFAKVREGVRSYLAVAGGFDIPVVLGSRSTYTRSKLGGLEGRALAAGDRLPTPWEKPAVRVEGGTLPPECIPTYGHCLALRVVMGPQDNAFTEDGTRTFLSSTYTVTPTSDRIGYRLEGKAIAHERSADIISDGNALGAVQVTGDGLPIILAADRGSTGGYTKIAVVISADMPSLAQAAPGDRITFEAVDVETAHQVLKEQESTLGQIRNGPRAVFTGRVHKVRVNGVEYEAVTPLAVQAWDTSESSAATPLHETLRVTVEGETYSLDVDVGKS
jgi:biotin-dependent carboxylase-like uncharacterized protein